MPDPIDILIAEDEQTDAFFLQHAFEKAPAEYNVHVVHDGEHAIDFLLNRSGYGAAPRPKMILMDINMPRKSGLEVLQEIKSTDAIKDIPVIMYSSSSVPADIRESYKNYANAYVQKPEGVDKMIEFINTLSTFWLRYAVLP